jgi:hypothetical protein
MHSTVSMLQRFSMWRNSCLQRLTFPILGSRLLVWHALSLRRACGRSLGQPTPFEDSGRATHVLCR